MEPDQKFVARIVERLYRRFESKGLEGLSEGGPQTRVWLVRLWEQTDEDDADDLLERVSEFFRPFENVVWELEPQGGEGRLSSRLADYIRAHLDEFHKVNAPPSRPLRWPNRRAAMS